MSKVKIDSEMQIYFTHNMNNYQIILDSPIKFLYEKLEAEIAIRIYKHAQQRLTNLQYEALKEGDQ